MAAVYTAHFEKKPFVALLQEITVKEATGVAVVKLPNGKEYTIHFKEGALVRLTKSGFSMENELLTLLKKSGAVSTEAFAEAEKKRLSTMRKMLDILMDLGHVSVMLYSKVVSALMRMLLIELLYEKRGTLIFQQQDKVKPFRSVRPITFLAVKHFFEEYGQSEKEVKKVLRNMHSEVVVSDKSMPFQGGLTLFENYLSGDRDFLEFLMNFLFCSKKKRCGLKRSLTDESFPDLLMRGVIRFATAVFVFMFVFSVITDSSYTEETASFHQGQCDFCTLLKVKIAENYYAFSFDRKPTLSELLSSGMITKEEFQAFQLIIKRTGSHTDTKENAHGKHEKKVRSPHE